MKKTIIVCVLILLFSSALFANDYLEASQRIHSINDPNKLRVALQGFQLSENEKTTLLLTNTKTAGGPFALNFLVGLGLGSFVQGDSTGGWVGLIGELASVAVYLSGYSQMIEASYTSTIEDDANGAGAVLLGALGLLGCRVYECIRPFTYAKSYNNALQEALVSAKTQIAFAPIIEEGEMKYYLGAKISF